MVTPTTLPRPERVGGDAGAERRVDAPREAEHHRVEAVLAHVVARAEHQRVVDLGLGLRARRGGRARACSAGFAAARRLAASSTRGSVPGVAAAARSLRGRGVAQPGVGDRVQVEVGDDQVLLEHRALGQHLALRAEDQARAVEDTSSWPPTRFT